LIPGIYQLIDSSLTHELRFDTISNNLANIGTTAFKKDVISFSNALSMNNTTATDLTPGPIRYTGNDLDVALDNRGFFKVQTPKGIRYTRNGTFTLKTDYTLTDQNGNPVLGQNGLIRVNGKNVLIKPDGQILVDGRPEGTILVVDFKHPRFLRKEGSTYFTYAGHSNDIYTVENPRIQQRYLEQSNVNMTEEMIKMVETLRAFESSEKAVQCIDEMMSKMVNDPALIQ